MKLWRPPSAVGSNEGAVSVGRAAAPAVPARERVLRGRTALPERVEDMDRAVLRLAWPIITENLFQTFLETASVALVGRLGALYLAGSGTATQMTWIGQSAASALAVGTMVLVARFVGGGDQPAANRTLKQSVTMGTLAGLLLGLLAVVVADPAIGVFGLEPAAQAIGASYLRINMGGIVFMLLMFQFGAALRGAGDSRTPMVVTGLINVVNVVLAFGLVFGNFGLPALAADGAAWASVGARAVGCALLAWPLLAGRTVLSLRGADGWRPDLAQMWRVLRIGLPSSAEQLIISFGMLAYSVMVVPLGTAVFAAQRISFNAFTFSFLPGMGCGLAATTLVGQALGAGRPDFAVAANRAAMRLALIWMGSCGVVLFLFPETVLHFFTDDQTLIDLATPALRVVAIGQPAWALSSVLSGSLRGGGDTRFPMWAALAGMWLIRVPVGFLVGIVLGFGLPGIFTSNCLDAVVRALVSWIRFRGGKWQRMRV